MLQTIYNESEDTQDPCICPTSPPAAAAAAAAPTGPQSVVIREIEDPAIIAAVNESIDDGNWVDLLMKDEKKEKVTDSSDCSKSLKIKGKAPCAPRDITYYVYVFRAKNAILARHKEEGSSKVMTFYKDDYVFVYSRHGDRFPEPDQVVVFRSDRTNRNPVGGNKIVKRYLYVRSFKAVADNCYFLGRATCHARAVVKGTTHMVNNANKAIEVYGIVLNADKTNQKKSRTDEDPKEFHYDTLWIEYDESNAAAACRKEVVTKTFSNIQVEYQVEKEPALDVMGALYSQDSQDSQKVASPTCLNNYNYNLNQNLETDKKTPVITAYEPETNEVEEYDYRMKDTHPKDTKPYRYKDSAEYSEGSGSCSGSDSGSESEYSECSECSEESSESEDEEEGSENENNFSGLAPSVDPIYNNYVYWGYQNYYGMGPTENNNNSVNMSNSLCPSFEGSFVRPPLGFTNGMHIETYEPFQGINTNACYGPVSALEVRDPENENSKALPQATNISNLKRRLVIMDGNLYRMDDDDDDVDDQAMGEEEAETSLPPPSKRARTD